MRPTQRAVAAGCAFLALAASAPTAPASGEPAERGAAAAPRVLQIRAKEVWVRAGERIQDGLVVVADGKIRSVGKGADADDGVALVQHDGVLTAGLIGCRTQSGTAGELQDDTRAVMPGVAAALSFEPAARDFRRALAAGITSVGIAPGPGNLVGGLACVVKTSDGRVLEPEAALAVTLSAPALGRSTAQGGFLFGAPEPEAPAAAGWPRPEDGGPEYDRAGRGTRAPTSYAGAIATLERLLDEGHGVFARAKRGELPVTIEAWDRHEVLRALALARKHELVGSIRGAPLAGDPDVVAALKESGFGAILGPFSGSQTRRSLESVKLLGEAGVPVGFALEGPWYAADELRLTAARALRAGASRDVVWKALTEDAARLVGAGEKTGALASGLDADLVLWSGDPLDLSSRPLAVYVDGARAWSAPAAR